MESIPLSRIACEACTVMLLDGSIAQSFIQVPVDKNEPRLTISTSGNHGLPGRDGMMGGDGFLNGGRGHDATPGEDGTRGEDAFENIVGFTSCDKDRTFQINHFHPFTMTLTNYTFDQNFDKSRVFLKARGGNGGSGGAGRQGGRGGKGRRGIDATEHSIGTDGGQGGTGGDGSNGGDGGDGGHSADIRIYVKQVDLDLLSAIAQINAGSPSGGRGGKPGDGGIGGPGGDGGNSYTWTESYRDSDGDTRYTTHTNRGGRSGASGLHGRIGMAGRDGLAGRSGNVSFWMYIPAEASSNGEPSLVEANTMYDLRLKSTSIVGGNFHIFEPNMCLSLLHLLVENHGDLESPVKLEFDINRACNSFIVPTHLQNPKVTTVIPARSQGIITDQPLGFAICDQPFVGNNLSLSIDTTLSIQAIAPRTAAILPGFHDNLYRFRIEYPVELTVASGRRAVLANGLIPLAIKLHNKSILSMGIQDNFSSPRSMTQKRKVTVVVEMLPFEDGDGILPGAHGPQFEITMPTNEMIGDNKSSDRDRYESNMRYFKQFRISTQGGRYGYQYEEAQRKNMSPSVARFTLNEQPVVFEIEHIPAQNEWLLGASLRLLPNQLSAYTKISLAYSLYLSDPYYYTHGLESPSANSHIAERPKHLQAGLPSCISTPIPARLIQREVHSIQVAEPCDFFKANSLANKANESSPPSPNALASIATRGAPIVPSTTSSVVSGFGSSVVFLVINSEVSKKEIHYWMELVRSLAGLYEVMIWNISLYNGVSYDQHECSFRRCAKDSLVIFLNTPFILPQRQNDGVCLPISYLNTADIFEAARRSGLRTYILNTGSDQKEMTQRLNDVRMRSMPSRLFESATIRDLPGPKKLVESLIHSYSSCSNEHLPNPSSDTISDGKLLLDSGGYHKVSLKLYRVLRQPTNAEFTEKYQELIKDLAESRPDRSYYIDKRFHSEIQITGIIRKRYEIGILEIRRGLDRTYASIACKTRYEQDLVMLKDVIFQIDQTSQVSTSQSIGSDAPFDLFVIIKLLPFTRKLILLDTLASSHTTTIMSMNRITLVQTAVLQGILSDIVDEQYVLFHATINNNNKLIKSNKITDLLIILKELVQFSFQYITINSIISIHLRDLYIKVAALVQCYPNEWLVFSHCMIQPTHDYLLHCIQKIDPLITKKVYNQHWKTIWRDAKVTPANRKETLQRWMTIYRDPFGSMTSGRVWMNHWTRFPDEYEIIKNEELHYYPPGYEIDTNLTSFFHEGDDLTNEILNTSAHCVLRHSPFVKGNPDDLYHYLSKEERMDKCNDNNVIVQVSGLSLDK